MKRSAKTASGAFWVRSASFCSVSALASLALIAPAAADPIGAYESWRVYSRTVDGETICFASTEPSDSSPRDAVHGDVYFTVASWKSGKALEQPSLVVGYDLRPQHAPKAKVGKTTAALYAVGQEAYFPTRSSETALVDALRKGDELRIETAAAKGGLIGAYTFSLEGAAAALNRARTECGFPTIAATAKKAPAKKGGKGKSKTKSKKKKR